MRFACYDAPCNGSVVDSNPDQLTEHAADVHDVVESDLWRWWNQCVFATRSLERVA